MPSIPCFICHQTYFESKKHEEEDIHFFKTPAHKLESWRKKLNNIHLLANSHLCSRHFEKKYINKFTRLGKECCKLSPDAEPTLLLCQTNKGNNADSKDEPKQANTRKSRTTSRSQAGTFYFIKHHIKIQH